MFGWPPYFGFSVFPATDSCQSQRPLVACLKLQFRSPCLLTHLTQTRQGPNHGKSAQIRLIDKEIFMNEATQFPPLPDRLSIDPRSPHHVAAVFEHDVGIRLNDKERLNVAEYCISEGWIKVPAGKTLDRKGNPLMITLKGSVQAFYR